MANSNPGWKQIPKEEFIELSKKYSSIQEFAKSFGLSRSTKSFSKYSKLLNISFNKSKALIPQDAFQKAVDKSSTIAEVIENLGYSSTQNSRYRQMKYLSNLYNIQLPIYDPKKFNAKGGMSKKMPDEEFFIVGTSRSSGNLRNRMLDKGVKYVCSMSDCPLHEKAEWRGKRITLQVDHVNGDSTDNRFENLRFLCANCHTQTETYANTKNSDSTKSGYCICGRIVYKTTFVNGCPHEVGDLTK